MGPLKVCGKGHEYIGKRCAECRREWRATNPGYDRIWYHEHAGYYRAWRTHNKERKKVLDRVRYAANPEPGKARTAAWKFAHPGYDAAWAAENPEKRSEINHRRRARKLGNQGAEPVTREHLDLLFEAQDGCCRYCRKPLGDDKHLDHRIPISRGGPHAPHNICWACPNCNLRKKAKTEAEFIGNSNGI